VQTQVLHPTDPKRSTLNHPVAAQAGILWDWAQRLEQEGDVLRCMELLERLLLLAPRHPGALPWLASLLRKQGMIEELLDVCSRWLGQEPDNPEALVRRGEALLALEQPREALAAFLAVLKVQPVHLLGHLGAAQAQAQLGGDPFPHLDAALELDRAVTRSVLEETFDYRILNRVPGERSLPFEELPPLLGISSAELRTLAAHNGLPLGADGSIRESELARWVGIQNRCQLRAAGLHWTAPTPRIIPELGAMDSRP
jgi:tetratricopeptide (TPR) repeat protein